MTSLPRVRNVVGGAALERPRAIVDLSGRYTREALATVVLGGDGDGAEHSWRAIERAGEAPGQAALVGAGHVVRVESATGREPASSRDRNDLVRDGATGAVCELGEVSEVRPAAM